LRCALYFFAVDLMLWAVAVHHTSAPARELGLGKDYLVRSMAMAFRLWLSYFAIEPFVRRLWPDLFISWSRLLAGRLQDPLVGRELLIGCLFGVAFSIATMWPETIRYRFDPNASTGGSEALARVLQSHQTGMIFALFCLAFLVLLRVLFRHTWIAAVVFTIGYVGFMAAPARTWEGAIQDGVWAACMVVLFIRFGLVAAMAGMFTVSALIFVPHTADFGQWYAQASMWALGAVLLVAGYGFYTSTLAVNPLFTGDGAAPGMAPGER
jgi:hypothetical protein